MKYWIVCLATSLAVLTEADASLVRRKHVPAVVSAISPLGRLATTNELRLAIGLPLRDTQGLDRLLAELYDPASSNYHRYLTPSEFTQQYGPSEQDYEAVIDFAKAKGLTVTDRHSNRMLVGLRGSVEKIEKALRTTIHQYRHPTEQRLFYAPDVEPRLNLGAPVLHISGLDNFTQPKPMKLSAVPIDQVTVAQPRAGSGPSGTYMGRDFRTAYVRGSALTGAGQSVALIAFDGYFASDIDRYRTQAGLSAVPLQNVLIGDFDGIPSDSSPGSANEEVALDIEMVISMASGLSRVIIYEAGPTATTADTDEMLNRIATDNIARQISSSWAFDTDIVMQQIFQQYAAQGQSFFEASGDDGAFVGTVGQPSDSPYLTVVGGTTLVTSSSQVWVSESTWSRSGGGVSPVYSIPTWQQGISMSANQGSTTMRNLPDVAMVAINVLAFADNGLAFSVQGTSISAPLWAGFCALINQQAAATGKSPVGFLNPALYTVGRSAAYSTSFHDITTGNNFNTQSPGRYVSTAGYDLCTGWGSPAGTNLINTLLSLPPDTFVVSPPFGFSASGSIGGPFNVTSQTYTLTNSGSTPLSWSLVNTCSWLTVSALSGTLAPHGPAATVKVSLNSNASNLLLGNFTANIPISNLSNGMRQDRQFDLYIGNGGFETGDFTDWSRVSTGAVFVDSIDTALFAGGPTIPGIDDSQFVHSGNYGVFFGQAGSLASLSKTLPTTAGQSYLLSFWVANPTNGTPNEFVASWDGIRLMDWIDRPAFGWTNFQYAVTARGPNSIVEFRSRNDPNAFAFDDVTLQLMPSLLIRASLTTDGRLDLTWNTAPGLAYQAQYTANLSPADWQDLGGPLRATGGTLTVTDAITPPFARFYRVTILQ